MLKILDISPMKMESVYFYRGPWFARNVHEIRISYVDVNELPEHDLFWMIGQYDMVFCCRPYGEKVWNAVRVAKSINRAVWIDYDDNIWGLNDPRYTGEDLYWMGQIGRLPVVADIVTVTNKYLAEKIRTHVGDTGNVTVVDNAFNDHVFRASDLLGAQWNKDSKVVYLRANGHASIDLIETVTSLTRMVHNNPDYKFVFIGRFDNYIRYSAFREFENVEFVDHTDIYQYHMMIRELKPSFYIRTLPDTPFNRGKSGCSVIESVYAGAIPLVPDLPEFTKYGSPIFSDDVPLNCFSQANFLQVVSNIRTMKMHTDDERISILKRKGFLQ